MTMVMQKTMCPLRVNTTTMQRIPRWGPAVVTSPLPLLRMIMTERRMITIMVITMHDDGKDKSVSVSVSAQDGIVALAKAHTRSAPSLSSLPKVALETVPIFVWLNTDRSRPWRVECRPLPFSTPLSFGRSVLRCCGLSLFRKVPQAPEHLRASAKTMILMNMTMACCLCVGRCLHVGPCGGAVPGSPATLLLLPSRSNLRPLLLRRLRRKRQQLRE